MRCEFLIDDGANIKGWRMIGAMIGAAPAFNIKCVVRKRDGYRGDCDLLMLYGVGHPIMMHNFSAHVASGRHAIGFDLGYFGRHTGNGYPMRLTIDAPHPQALIEPMPPGRWADANITLRHDYNPAGHIVLCGLGRKGRHQFGYKDAEWEIGMLNKIKEACPGRKVIYRPKAGALDPIGCPSDPNSAIEKVIYGASLVVVRHSNVAIDACIAGIPVVCEDGAAAALYKGDLTCPKIPTTQERLEFLQSLAYWQWRPSEAASCWKFILGRLSSST